MRKLISQVVGKALIGLVLVLGASGTASGSVTTKITNHSTDGNHKRAISGSNVVWRGQDPGDRYGDWEIYPNASQLTNDALAVSALQGRMNGNPWNRTD